jgi:hypothetical protein
MLKRPAAAAAEGAATRKGPAVSEGLLKRPAVAAGAAASDKVSKRPAVERGAAEAPAPQTGDGGQLKPPMKKRPPRPKKPGAYLSPGHRAPKDLVIDHFVWVVPKLEEGIAEFESLTGVKPAIGGKHLGFGTHNALVSLGEGIYLEILAKDPSQPESKEAKFLGVDKEEMRLATWCARPASPEKTLEVIGMSATKAFYSIGEIQDMSRTNTEGQTLRWRLASTNHSRGHVLLPYSGLLPFLVDWTPNELPHPSETAPGGCTFVSLTGFHPNPWQLELAIEGLGAGGIFVPTTKKIVIKEAEKAKMELVIMTPKGKVTLS